MRSRSSDTDAEFQMIVGCRCISDGGNTASVEVGRWNRVRRENNCMHDVLCVLVFSWTLNKFQTQ